MVPTQQLFLLEDDVVVLDGCKGGATWRATLSIEIHGTLIASCSGSTDGSDLILEAPSVFVATSARLVAGDGRDASALATHKCPRGDIAAADGGTGGNIVLRGATIVLQGTVVLGSGGRGGDAIFTTCATSDAVARAGNGGESGALAIAGELHGRPNIEGGLGGAGGHALVMRDSPNENSATVYGSNGTPIVDANGGSAKASGADGSRSTVDGEDGGDAWAYGGQGALGALIGGRGGDAIAWAGNGSAGKNVHGLAERGGNGGRGGDAFSQAGRGGPGPIGGSGGDAFAQSGRGGSGGHSSGDGGTLISGPGGEGGDAGAATAIGADGALGPAVHGGHGGNATALLNVGGNGGWSTGLQGNGGNGGYVPDVMAIGGAGNVSVAGNGGSGGYAFAKNSDAGEGGGGSLQGGDGNTYGSTDATGGAGGFGFNGGAGGGAGAVGGRPSFGGPGVYPGPIPCDLDPDADPDGWRTGAWEMANAPRSCFVAVATANVSSSPSDGAQTGDEVGQPAPAQVAGVIASLYFVCIFFNRRRYSP